MLLLTAVATVSAQVYLYNGSFTQCASGCDGEWSVPTAWQPQRVDATTGIWRNTESYYSAPAALTIWAQQNDDCHYKQTPDAEGTQLPGPKGSEYTFEAMVKVDTLEGQVQLVMQYGCDPYFACNNAGESTQWQMLWTTRSTTDGWVQVSTTATVPDDYHTKARFRIYTRARAYWSIDDIKINGQDEIVSIDPRKHVYQHASAPARVANGDARILRIYRPDGREVRATTPSGIVLDSRSMAPGCYLTVREGANGIVTERTLTK